jgi:hypothetical protein
VLCGFDRRCRIAGQFRGDADALDCLGDPEVDRATACSVAARLHEHALRQPAPRNVQVLRFVQPGSELQVLGALRS